MLAAGLKLYLVRSRQSAGSTIREANTRENVAGRQCRRVNSHGTGARYRASSNSSKLRKPLAAGFRDHTPARSDCERLQGHYEHVTGGSTSFTEKKNKKARGIVARVRSRFIMLGSTTVLDCQWWVGTLRGQSN